jgi:hypothetical protein
LAPVSVLRLELTGPASSVPHRCFLVCRAICPKDPPIFFTGAGASLRGCRGHFRKVVKRATLCHTSFCSLSHLEGAVIHRFNESEILWPTGHSKISLSLPPSFSSLISLLFSLSFVSRYREGAPVPNRFVFPDPPRMDVRGSPGANPLASRRWALRTSLRGVRCVVQRGGAGGLVLGVGGGFFVFYHTPRQRVGDDDSSATPTREQQEVPVGLFCCSLVGNGHTPRRFACGVCDTSTPSSSRTGIRTPRRHRVLHPVHPIKLPTTPPTIEGALPERGAPWIGGILFFPGDGV